MENPKFTAGKHEWPLKLTIARAEKWKDDHGLNIADASDGKLLLEVGSNQFKLFEAIWVLCEDLASERGIDKKQFAKIFDDRAIEDACHGLVKAVINFTAPQQRGTMEVTVEAINRESARAAKTLDKWLKSPEAAEEMEAKVKRLIQENMSETSGSS